MFVPRKATHKINGRLQLAWQGPTEPAVYAYMLGLYLGDGCLVVPGRGSSRITFSLDEKYPAIIERACLGLAQLLPETSVCTTKGRGQVVVGKTHPAVHTAFPQHGPGKKHERRIELCQWQLEVTRVHPKDLIAGLIDSDGSRCTNSFKTMLPSGRMGEYSYPRYFFTNYSADIRQIFIDHCSIAGIHATQSSFKNISISHRDSVAKLDEFVGPKR